VTEEEVDEEREGGSGHRLGGLVVGPPSLFSKFSKGWAF
jgi:hypothetical protein